MPGSPASPYSLKRRLFFLICALLAAGAVGPLPTSGQSQRSLLAPEPVFYYQVSPDSVWIVYITHSSEPSDRLLYSQHLGTNERTLLATVETGSFDITPDSTHVVVNIQGSGLFSVPIAGGSLTRLSPVGERVPDRSHKISPDGNWVVFPTKAVDGPGSAQLYSVPITGGTPTLIGTSTIYQGWENHYLLISEDSQSIVTKDGSGSFLYQSPIAGGTPRRLSPTDVMIGDFFYNPFVLVDNYLVFTAKAAEPLGVNVYHISLTDGSLRRGTSFPSGYDGVEHLAVTKSEEHSRLAFAIRHTIGEYTGAIDQMVYELFSVESDGSQLTQLTATSPGAMIRDVRVSPDGSHVAFAISDGASKPGTVSLYSVPITGGTPQLLVSGAESLVGFSGDSSTVIFKYPVNLASVPTTGGRVTRLNVMLRAGQRVVWASLSPNGKWVLYGLGTGAGDPPQIESLYSVRATGGRSRSISGSLVPNGTIWEFFFTPDSEKIVYRVYEGGSGAMLYLYADAESLFRIGDGRVRDTFVPIFGR